MKQIDVQYYHDEYCGDDELIKWYKRYKKRNAQTAKIKEELLPVAQHLNRVKDWHMSEDEKRLWR